MADTNDPDLDPALLRGLTQSRMGRRDLLRMFGAGAAGVGATAFLSACGVGGQGVSHADAKAQAAGYWKGKRAKGVVDWANWPLYIDTAGKNSSRHPSIEAFTRQTGTKVNYFEDIQDNGPFFAKVQPSLSAGQFSGYDLAVISAGIYFNKFRDLGFFIPLDHDRLPNFDKYGGAKFKNPVFDTGNTYSIPYQAGFTGIGYDPEKTGREITSFEDLQDPKFKGKIGMFANNEDLPNSALLAVGVDPQQSTEKDWRKAADWLQKQQPLVRKYYSQDYISDLAKGDIWITQAWSGDIYQQNLSSGSNLKFVIPKERGLLWTDNFVLLKYAEHPVDAMKLMNFYYEPKPAAMLAEWVNYISPVPKAQQVVENDAAKASGSDATFLKSVAHSYAVFPTQSTYDKAVIGFTPKEGKQLDTWNSIFEPIYQG
ncbi:MAG: polyamine ABC transporter substrate-binding protein [Marmoricola sp.]